MLGHWDRVLDLGYGVAAITDIHPSGESQCKETCRSEIGESQGAEAGRMSAHATLAALIRARGMYLCIACAVWEYLQVLHWGKGPH